jgi:hypothetical protein
MDARQHLAAVVAAISNWVDAGASDKPTVQAVHAARNFLTIPEPPALEPKAFQQLVCQRLRSRADAQRLPAKGVKRERAYIEGLMGAGMALEALGSDQLNPFLILATLGTIRGAVETVNAVAEGKPLP